MLRPNGGLYRHCRMLPARLSLQTSLIVYQFGWGRTLDRIAFSSNLLQDNLLNSCGTTS